MVAIIRSDFMRWLVLLAIPLAGCSSSSSSSASNPGSGVQAPSTPVDWKTAESNYLTDIKPVTTVFAGAGYFSPDGKKVIYQAEEKGTGNPFYQIFVQDLGNGVFNRVSPGAGRTTCSYFRPDGKKIIYASSHGDPAAKAHQEAEYKQR